MIDGIVPSFTPLNSFADVLPALSTARTVTVEPVARFSSLNSVVAGASVNGFPSLSLPTTDWPLTRTSKYATPERSSDASNVTLLSLNSAF
ncbi:hypothetical protein [Bacillus sp. V2I10]|uniref:hypothetical protein n=1 Tax=Bacillus sp. V2I10 TaxID=3042276 RepID=UPI0027814036|nr:hypothetical protein [Bacillus sp. V2I10]MDQ0857217.1 hypothetical protein [Bacillus sp. V2I10]